MTCESRIIQEECLIIGDRVPITVDFSLIAARRWRRAAIFASGDHIRGSKSGFEFVAGGNGQTGDKEPRWPKTLGDTVQDGSIEWTAAAVSTDSLLKTLASATWEADASITISGEAIDSVEQTALAYLEPATAGTYEVIVWASFSDSPVHKEGFVILVTVEE